MPNESLLIFLFLLLLLLLLLLIAKLISCIVLGVLFGFVAAGSSLSFTLCHFNFITFHGSNFSGHLYDNFLLGPYRVIIADTSRESEAIPA
jgi:hypothetical protein